MATSPKTGDEELGRRVIERREALGMSRTDLAEATGLSYPYMAQIETGYRFPSTKQQFVLAQVLGLSLDELLGTEDVLPQRTASMLIASAPMAPPPAGSRRGNRRTASPKRPSLDDAVDAAATALEELPAQARLEALSQVQLRILSGVADDRARNQR